MADDQEFGYISLSRKIADMDFFSEDREFSKFEAWVDLIMEAAWKDHKAIIGMTPFIVHRGEVIHSQRTLAKRWGWSQAKIYRFIQMLIQQERIAIKTESGISRISIVNYERYQNGSVFCESAMNQQRINDESAMNRERIKQNKDNKDNNSSLSACAREDGSEITVPANIQQAAFSAFGAVAGAMLQSWLSRYPPDWVLDAIAETEAAGVQNTKYTAKILKRWAEDEKNGQPRDKPGSGRIQTGAGSGKPPPAGYVPGKYAAIGAANSARLQEGESRPDHPG